VAARRASRQRNIAVIPVADDHNKPEQPGSAGELSAVPGVLVSWTRGLSRFAWLICLGFIIATLLVLQLTIDRLGISTDTSDMLSARLEFRQIYSDYRESLPQFIDTMIVVVTADTPEQARQAGRSLVARLERDTGLFKSVYRPGDDEFFDKQGLLYLGINELHSLADRLVGAQALLGYLARDPSLTALLELTEQALDRREPESEKIVPLLRELDAAVVAASTQRYHRLSWERLLQGGTGGDGPPRQLIILQPRLDYNQLQPAAGAMQAVRQAVLDLDLDTAHGVRVQVTGEVALAYEELQSAKRGAATAGMLSFVLVAVVLGAGLGRWQLVVATVITLVCGLVLTAGFAAVTIGHLNLISIAFAVLYIGLGVDYAIHLCLRYLESLQGGRTHVAALTVAIYQIGGSLVICTLTTAAGFYAFVPTSFTGVSELGLIAGTSMLISLFLSLSLLPALLSALPRIRGGDAMVKQDRALGRLLRTPARYPRRVLWPAAAAAIVALFALQAVRFDADPINLRDPASESVKAFKELLLDSATSPWTLNVLASDHAGARRLVAKLDGLPEVEAAVSIDRFLPVGQDKKLAVIDDLRLLLGPPPTPPGRSAVSEDRFAALTGFATAIGTRADANPETAAVARSLRKHLDSYLLALASLSADAREQRLSEFEASLLVNLPPLLGRLRSALEASRFGFADLPAQLRQRWVTPDGRYRIDVLSAKPLLDEPDLQAFVSAVRTVAPRATGAAVFNIESGRVVVSAFVQALLSALLVIVLLLLVLLPRKRDTVLVLVPLLLASLLTAAIAAGLGIAFNFANVIALPLLLGIGVDSGVHMVHRFRRAPPADGDLLGSSTMRAVIVSTLTTIGSFGNLAFSPHPGAASMGLLLAIGTATTLLCMLLVLPALLYRRRPLTDGAPA